MSVRGITVKTKIPVSGILIQWPLVCQTGKCEAGHPGCHYPEAVSQYKHRIRRQEY